MVSNNSVIYMAGPRTWVRACVRALDPKVSPIMRLYIPKPAQYAANENFWRYQGRNDIKYFLSFLFYYISSIL